MGWKDRSEVIDESPSSDWKTRSTLVEQTQPKRAGFLKSAKAAYAEEIPFVGRKISESILGGEKTFFEPDKTPTSKFYPDIEIKPSSPFMSASQMEREDIKRSPIDLDPLTEAIKESPRRLLKQAVTLPASMAKAAAYSMTPLGATGAVGTASAMSLGEGASEAFQREKKKDEKPIDIIKEYSKDIGVQGLFNLAFLLPGIGKKSAIPEAENFQSPVKPNENMVVTEDGNVVPASDRPDLAPHTHELSNKQRENLSKDPKLLSTYNKFMTSLYSERHPLDTIEKIFGQDVDKLPSDSFKIMQRSDSVVAYENSKLYDEHLSDTYGKNPEKFNEYAIARRTLEKQKQINEYRADAGLPPAPNIATGLTLGEAQSIVDQAPKEYESAFNQLSKSSSDDYKEFLSYVVGKGNVNKVMYKNQNYIRLKPKAELIPERNAPYEAQVAQPGLPSKVRTLKGEAGRKPSDFEDVTLQTMKNRFQIKRANAYFKMLNEFHDSFGKSDDPNLRLLFKQDPSIPQAYVATTEKSFEKTFYGPQVSGEDTLDPDVMLSLARPPNLPKDALMIPVNGKQVFYRFTKEGKPLLDLLAQEPNNLQGVGSVLRAWSKFSRMGMTEANPFFYKPGFLAHSAVRGVLSPERYPYQFLVNYPKAIIDVMGKTKDYEQFLKAGGGMTSITSMDVNQESQMFKNLPPSAKWWATHPLEGFRRLLWWSRHPVETSRALSEKLTQIPAQADFNVRYKNLLRQKVDPEMALRKASVQTIDAGPNYLDVGKTAGRQIRAVEPFSNAWIRSFDPIAKSLKNNKAQLFMGAMKYVTAPSLGLWLMNRKDPEYQKLSNDDKAMNLHVNLRKWGMDVPQGEDPFFRIKRPWALGWAGGRLLEDFMDYMDKKDPEAVDRMLYDSKLALPHFGGPIMNALTIAMTPRGYNFFTHREVLSEAQMKRLPAERFGPRTSETAKAIGEMTRGLPTPLQVSPAKLDAFLQSQAGGSARLVIKGLDKLGMGVAKLADIYPYYSKVNAYEDVGYKTGINQPLLNNFMITYDKSRQAYESLKMYQNSNPRRFKDLRSRYMGDLKNWYALSPIVPQLSEAMKEQSRLIENDPKNPQIEVMGNRINDLLEKTKEEMKKLESR